MRFLFTLAWLGLSFIGFTLAAGFEVPPIVIQDAPSALLTKAVAYTLKRGEYALPDFHMSTVLSWEDIDRINAALDTPTIAGESSLSMLNTGSLILSELIHAGGFPQVTSDLRNLILQPTYAAMHHLFEQVDPARQATPDETKSILTAVHTCIQKNLQENLLGTSIDPYLKLFVDRTTRQNLTSDTAALRMDAHIKTLAAAIFCARELNPDWGKDHIHEDVVRAFSAYDVDMDILSEELCERVWGCSHSIIDKMKTLSVGQFDILPPDQEAERILLYNGFRETVDDETTILRQPVTWITLKELLSAPLSSSLGLFEGIDDHRHTLRFSEQQTPEDGTCGLHSVYGVDDWNASTWYQKEQRVVTMRKDTTARLMEVISNPIYRNILLPVVGAAFSEEALAEQGKILQAQPQTTAPQEKLEECLLKKRGKEETEISALEIRRELIKRYNQAWDYENRKEREKFDQELDAYLRSDAAYKDYIHKEETKWVHMLTLDVLTDVLLGKNLRVWVKDVVNRRLVLINDDGQGGLLNNAEYPRRTDDDKGTLHLLQSHSHGHFTILRLVAADK